MTKWNRVPVTGNIYVTEANLLVDTECRCQVVGHFTYQAEIVELVAEVLVVDRHMPPTQQKARNTFHAQITTRWPQGRGMITNKCGSQWPAPPWYVFFGRGGDEKKLFLTIWKKKKPSKMCRNLQKWKIYNLRYNFTQMNPILFPNNSFEHVDKIWNFNP